MTICHQLVCSRRTAQCAVLFATVILASAASAAAPANNCPQQAGATEYMDHDPLIVDSRLHVAGNLRLGIANVGLLGQPNLTVVHPADDSAYPPVNSFSPFFEFPAGSFALHLYEGGLWIGGIVDGDTLATTALDARSYEAREFSGFDSMHISSNLQTSDFYDPSAISQQQFDCRFSDTLRVHHTDELDNRPHRPIGVEVSQTSHAWLSEPYDDFIIVVSTIRNISENVIEGLHFGFCTDADVYWRSPFQNPPLGTFQDDMSGYLPDHAIAYAIDNDGDPIGDSLWDTTSVRSAYAVIPITIEPEPCCTTFNWWGLSPTDYFPIGSQEPDAPPRGDRVIYRTMASDSIEGDQLFVAARPGGPPRDPRSPLDGIADGMDTRFMLSFGAYDLQPGDSIRFVYAFVAGDSIHQDPTNFATNFRASDPQPFYDNLYFGDLIRNAEAARLIYHNVFDLIGGASPKLSFKPLTDYSVEIHWAAAPFQEIAGYRIYRRVTDQTPEWERVGETIGADLRCFTDRDLSVLPTYEYAVAAVGIGGQEGFKSRPFAYKAGLPSVIPSIEVAQDMMDITIRWSVAIPEATFAPLEYINIYRRTGNDSVAVRHASVPVIGHSGSANSRTGDRLSAGSRPRLPLRPAPELTGEFRDQDVESGTEYWYSLSVTNTLGVEGPRSEEVRSIPMALDRPGIVVVEMDFPPTEAALNLIVADSTVGFYSQWAGGRDFDTMTVHACDPRYWGWCGDPRRDSAYALARLSRYATAVFVWEDAGGSEFTNNIVGAIEDYMRFGGRCIMVGRNIPAQLSYQSPGLLGPDNKAVDLEPDRFGSRVLGVIQVIVEGSVVPPAGDPPEITIYMEFVGALSASAIYPDLAADTVRALSIPLLTRPDARIIGEGLVPVVGALTSFTDAEALYTYGASFPDTSSLQGLPIAIKGTKPEAQFVLFDFPLSLMEHEAAYQALDAALADLHNLSSAANRVSRTATIDGILDYIYHRADQPPTPAFDTNRDGVIDLRDVVLSLIER